MTTSPEPIDRLYSQLEEVLGPEHTETFMNHVATRTDIAELKESVDSRFDQVDNRLDQVDDRFDRVEQRLDRLERDLRQLIKRYRKFEDRIDLKLDRMHEIMHTQFRHYTIYLLAGMTVLVGLVSFLG